LKAHNFVYDILYQGSIFHVKVMKEKEEIFERHMPIIEHVDTSKIITSPMPGSIVSVKVKPGEMVHPTQNQ